MVAPARIDRAGVNRACWLPHRATELLYNPQRFQPVRTQRGAQLLLLVRRALTNVQVQAELVRNQELHRLIEVQRRRVRSARRAASPHHQRRHLPLRVRERPLTHHALVRLELLLQRTVGLQDQALGDRRLLFGWA